MCEFMSLKSFRFFWKEKKVLSLLPAAKPTGLRMPRVVVILLLLGERKLNTSNSLHAVRLRGRVGSTSV